MLRLIRKLAGIEDGPRLDIMKDILRVKMLNHPCISVLVRLPRFSVPLELLRIFHRRTAYLYDANQHQRLHQTSSVCSTTLTTQYPYQTQPPHIFTARVRYVSQTMNQTDIPNDSCRRACMAKYRDHTVILGPVVKKAVSSSIS